MHFGDFLLGGMIILRLYTGLSCFPNRCQLAINSSPAGSQGVRILLGSRYHGFPHIFGRWGRRWCANKSSKRKGDGLWERKEIPIYYKFCFHIADSFGDMISDYFCIRSWHYASAWLNFAIKLSEFCIELPLQWSRNFFQRGKWCIYAYSCVHSRENDYRPYLKE